MKNGRKKKSSSPFQVGEKVRFLFGSGKATGTIVEDHGAIGHQRRHFYRIAVPADPEDPIIVERTEDDITRPDPADEIPPIIEKSKAIQYLRYGGLESILFSNMTGGKYQPRVWLCVNILGDITHTFYQERGIIGGQTVPLQALWGSKILAAKKEEVIAFIESLGLTKKEAEELVAEMGIKR